jgi:hypothetical protein
LQICNPELLPFLISRLSMRVKYKEAITSFYKEIR